MPLFCGTPPKERKFMTNQKIYEGALKVLAETSDMADNEDYEIRAPYLIAAFCSETEEVDIAYRKANGIGDAEKVNDVYLPLESNFPRAPRFASAACIYLASMLIIDTAPELSERLYDKFSDMLATICASIPQPEAPDPEPVPVAVIEDIIDRYGF